MPSAGTGPVSRSVPVILALLTVLGPASMDLYLPVLPASPGTLAPAPCPRG
jgi:hypothetical protein